MGIFWSGTGVLTYICVLLASDFPGKSVITDIDYSAKTIKFLEPGDFHDPGMNYPFRHVSPDLLIFFPIPIFIPRYLSFASARSLFSFALAFAGAIWRALSKESRASV